MWGWNSLLRSGSGIAVVGAVLALALGWPLSSFLGPHVLYLAYFVSALVVTRIGGGSGALCVLTLGSCAGLFRSLPFPSAMTTDPAWEAWTLLLYYGAGVASIVVIDSTRRSRPSSGPHLANRLHRQTESTLADDAIPPRVFLEQSRDGIHILDRNGKLRGANRKFEEMLGYSHAEIKNLHVWDWDAQWTREELLERIGGSDSVGALFETRHRRKDGVVIDVEVSASRVEWREQSLYYCVSRDFSERKQAEQALRESEERFRVLVEQAADAFFVLDKRGSFVDVNHMACEILGYSRPELLGMRVVDVEQEFDQEGVEELLSRIESGRALTAHAHARRKDGTCFPVEVRFSRYTIQGQQLFLALVCDITERQTRERELERTNRLYAILSAVNQTILRVTTREDLFREICRITVEHVGFKVVWVGWHDPETHAVVPSASAGDQEGYLDGIKVYADDRPEGLGPVGVCVRTGKPCIIYDFVNDPRARPWRQRAIAHGIRSAAALPLRLGGEVCGVFIVYAGETDVFQDREVSLLQEIADSISFAMDHLEQEDIRQQAEESLRRREAQYRAVIETCSDGFWMMNEEGRILEVNDAYVRCSGYRREELVGMHISALKAKEQPAETAARILKIRQNGTDLFESSHQAKDGTVWPVEVNAAYWPSAGGRTMVFLRDITGRKQAEEALVERARLAALGADIGIALTRGDTLREILRSCSEAIVQHIDAAFARIWTLNPQQGVLELQASAGMYTHIDGPHGRVPVGHLKVGLIAQERRPHLTNAVIGDPRVGNQEWAQREGMVSFAGYPLVVKDRLVGVIALFARRPLTHATLQAMASVADEIALGIDQKRADEELRDSEAKLQAIVNTAFGAIITIDVEGTVLSFNPSAERVFGYAKAEVLGRNVSMLMPLPHSQEHRNYMARYLRTGDRHIIGIGREITAQRKDGTIFPAEIGVSETRVGGKVIFVGILLDITERKAAEKEIRNLNASLELMVARRTAELESMLANATIGLAFFDRDFRFIRINHCLAEFNGIPLEAHLGRSLRDLLPEIAETVEPIVLQVFETGRPFTGIEFQATRPARPGELRSWLDSFYPVLDLDGTVISVGATVTEITEQKQAEEALAALNRALRQEIAERERVEQQVRMLAAVLEASPDLVGIADPSGRVIHLNRAFSEALGRSPETEPLMIRDCHPPDALRIFEEEGLPTAAPRGLERRDRVRHRGWSINPHVPVDHRSFRRAGEPAILFHHHARHLEAKADGGSSQAPRSRAGCGQCRAGACGAAQGRVPGQHES